LQKSSKTKIINEDQYEYFNTWYHCVVRELVTFIDFQGDYKILGKKLNPHISQSQARESVKLLLRLGFLKKVKGRYIQQDPVIQTGNNLGHYNVLNFNLAMLNIFLK